MYRIYLFLPVQKNKEAMNKWKNKNNTKNSQDAAEI